MKGWANHREYRKVCRWLAYVHGPEHIYLPCPWCINTGQTVNMHESSDCLSNYIHISGLMLWAFYHSRFCDSSTMASAASALNPYDHCTQGMPCRPTFCAFREYRIPKDHLKVYKYIYLLCVCQWGAIIQTRTRWTISGLQDMWQSSLHHMYNKRTWSVCNLTSYEATFRTIGMVLYCHKIE